MINKLYYYEDQFAQSYVNSKIIFDFQGISCQFRKTNVDIHFVSDHNFNENRNAKVKIYLGIFNNEENQIKKFLEKNLDCYYLTNAVDYTVIDKRIIFNDFLFNRTKAYYSKTGYTAQTPLWYYAGDDCYVINELDFKRQRSKIFLAVNNTYRNHLHSRPMIMSYLLKNKDRGYLGDASNKEMFLKAEGNPSKWSAYHPVANQFYQDTYLSIYGESIEFGTSIAITEKTFEPLLKGHFILPFSSQGFIKHLKNIGFQFPFFINYDYDEIEDYRSRYDNFHEEMMRLVNMPLKRWQNFYFDYRHIIDHNRKLMLGKPFHKIDFNSLLACSSVVEQSPDKG